MMQTIVYNTKFIFLISIAIILTPFLNHGQVIDIKSIGTVHALVIGISDYENIYDLSFAHKDAKAFHQYLKTNYPKLKVDLLLNDEATEDVIYTHLYNYLEEMIEGDTLFFFFSGHGANENKLPNESGYLLTHKSPENNYGISALKVRDLKEFIHAFSLKKDVEVIMFIDACRAGNLNGNSLNGSGVTAAALKEIFGKEIKILSCQPNQLSIEQSNLDDGHGLFTFHLLGGLTGKSDKNGDFKIELHELWRFLMDSMKSQTPVVSGDLLSVIASYKPNRIAFSSFSNAKKFGRPPAKEKEKQIFNNQLKIDSLKEKFEKAIIDKRIISPIDSCAFFYFNQVLNGDSDERVKHQMKNKLIQALKSFSKVSLEKYIKNETNNITLYECDKNIQTLEIIDELIDSNYVQYNQIQAWTYFFRALRENFLEEPDMIGAIDYLNTSIKFENAAYVLNELGNIYKLQEDFILAEKAYKTAISIAPKWEIAANNFFKINELVKKTESSRIGKDYALFFAINDYDEWNDLNYPIKGAKTIAKDLEEHYGFMTVMIENPTQEEIINILLDYSQRSYKDDAQLMIFFSGHGKFDEVTKRGFFIPKDGKLNDSYQNTYIPYTKLKPIIDNIPCKHILVTIDANYSDFSSISLSKNRRPGEGEIKMKDLQRYINDKLKYKSRLYLTSRTKEQTADGNQYSPFTERILEALKSYGGDDRVLTFKELEGYMDNVVPISFSGEFGQHEPRGSFLFILNNNSVANESATNFKNGIKIVNDTASFYNRVNLSYCLPNSPITLSKMEISKLNIIQKLKEYNSVFNDSLIDVLKKRVAICKLKIQKKLQEIETKISKLLLDAQEVLSNEDVAGIEKQILEFEESKIKSKDALRDNLNNIPHTGVFAVLIKNVDLYEDPQKMLNDAKMILEDKAIKDLNGTYINKYTSIQDYKEVKDVIETLTNGEAISERAYHSAPNYLHNYFLYVANVTIKPLSTGVSKEIKRHGIEYLAINLLDDLGYKEDLIKYGITDSDLTTLESIVSIYERSIVRNRNEGYDEMHLDALKVGNEKIKKIDQDINEAKNKLRDRKNKVADVCKKHNITFDEMDINKSVDEASEILQEKIEQLQNEWKKIKEKEILHKEAYVSIQDDPFNTLGNKGIELYNQLLNEYAQYERNQEEFWIENFLTTENKNFHEVEGYRDIERIWVYPIPQENTEQHLGYFKLVVFAKFKIE